MCDVTYTGVKTQGKTDVLFITIATQNQRQERDKIQRK